MLLEDERGAGRYIRLVDGRNFSYIATQQHGLQVHVLFPACSSGRFGPCALGGRADADADAAFSRPGPGHRRRTAERDGHQVPRAAVRPTAVRLPIPFVSPHPSTDLFVLLFIPFLSIGDLRLRLPKPISPYNGTIDATAFGNQCIQQTSEAVSLPSTVPAAVGGYVASFLARADVPFSEDCECCRRRLACAFLGC